MDYTVNTLTSDVALYKGRWKYEPHKADMNTHADTTMSACVFMSALREQKWTPAELRPFCQAMREDYNFIKIDLNCNFVGLLHHPFWLQLVLALLGSHFPDTTIPSHVM